MKLENIFADIPFNLDDEVFQTIKETNNVRIERIISKGQVSPKDFWYDQEENEWVILLKGSARLLFEDGELVELNSGDYLNIPANKKHRVEWTSKDSETIWVAVFYS